ncbi:hypothetical protein EJ08DRAFT_187382 [Tothia fuscella]|uniref:SET domain-containing protein n=1 Tax=Tothia fuscella TaxID=1048955 RepID=A0A9P4NTP5_9PEZI|nr:hypothetical protein EJ08DRAFT_187382 [Tothia fuscella]
MAPPTDPPTDPVLKFKELCTAIKITQTVDAWTERAYWFMEQGYWELSAFDYHHILHSFPHTIETRSRAQFGLARSLHELGANTAARALLAAIPPRKEPEEAQHLANVFNSTHKDGDKPLFFKHKYPWMTFEETTRDTDHMRPVSQEYNKYNLEIDKCSFLVDSTVWGVYTKSGLNKTDKPFYNEGIITAPCLGADTSADELYTFYLQTLIERNIQHINEPWNPLKDPAIKLLTTDYVANNATFSYEKYIVQPYNILQSNGILFHELRFDWWYLFTVYWRLSCNAVQIPPEPTDPTQQWHVGFSTPFTFFNHSCAPNVIYTTTSPPNALIQVHLTALHNIRPNSELFISFLTPAQLMLPVETRRLILRRWIGGNCMCNKCVWQDSDPTGKVGGKRKRVILERKVDDPRWNARKSPRKVVDKRRAVGVNAPDDDFEDMDVDFE